MGGLFLILYDFFFFFFFFFFFTILEAVSDQCNHRFTLTCHLSDLSCYNVFTVGGFNSQLCSEKH